MRKIYSILVALAACVVLVGVAAAESPDMPDTWEGANDDFTINNGYNFVDGQLVESPVDNIDVWGSQSTVDKHFDLYLNSVAYNNNVKAQMYDADDDLMMQVFINGNLENDDTLDTSDLYVKITGDLEDRDYTFCVYKAN